MTTRRRDDSAQQHTDGPLDYFMSEADRLMADQRRVKRERDAMVLRNALHWPPTSQAPPKLPFL